MRQRALFILLISLFWAGGAAGGCGSSGNVAPGDDGGTDVTVADGGGDSAPDGAGDAAPDGPGDDGGPGSDAAPLPGSNFAFRQYFLGDTTRAGVKSASAWKDFGTNIDGKVTTTASTDVCTLAVAAPKNVQNDGTGGIDNSWGQNLIPLLIALSGASFTPQYNAAVDGGAFTNLLNVQDLVDDAGQTGAAPAEGFVGQRFPGAPTWSPADDWPVAPEWLNDGKTLAGGSKIAFPAATIAAGQWTSGAPVDLPFILLANGVALDLVVHHAAVSFTHAAPAQASAGIVSGVLYTSELLDAVRRAAGSLSSSLCSGSTFDALKAQIEQMQDILHDGTNVAGQPCDAISFGIGFEATQIGPAHIVGLPEPPPPDPCDAGAE
jgi:hypothetical protein